MVEIKNAEDFEAWLNTRSDKNKNAEVQILTTRCALRVFPYLVTDERTDNKTQNKLVLSTCRSLAISWLARTYPPANKNSAHKYINAVRNAVNYFYNDQYDQYDHYGASIGYAENVATIASYAADNFISSRGNTLNVSLDIGLSSNGPVFWQALENDCRFIENGMSLLDLITSPIWLNNTADATKAVWLGLQRQLTYTIPFKDQNWDVWIRWYEDRLHGRPANEALEIARATLPNELWEQGAKAVNNRILELELEHNPPPPQTKGALNFKANDEGQLDLSEPARGLKHETDEDAQERHQEVLSNAQTLSAAISSNARMGNDPNIIEILDKFIHALGQSIQTINKNTLFPRGERLRKRNSEQETMALDRNYDSDYPPLPDDIADMLGELVGSYNMMVGLDPELAKCDQLRLGPDAKENLASPQMIYNITGDFYNNCAITQNVHEAIIEEAENAPEIPEIENRLSQRASEGFRNMIRATGAFIWKHIGKISASSGAAVLIAASKLLVVYKIELLIALDNAPWLVRLISNIEKILPALG